MSFAKRASLKRDALFFPPNTENRISGYQHFRKTTDQLPVFGTAGAQRETGTRRKTTKRWPLPPPPTSLWAPPAAAPATFRATLQCIPPKC